MDATTGAQRDAYYTEPCECGATPALHLGHTQACADRHASAAVEYPATVTATPVGKGRNGKPITRVERHEIRKEPEPFGSGRSRIFVRRADLDVPGSYPRYAPMVVLTDSIQYVDAAERIASEEDRRTFRRGDVVTFGKAGRVAWVVTNADPERNLYSIASDRVSRYLRPEELERIKIICPADIEPDLDTPKGRTVASLRARQRI